MINWTIQSVETLLMATLVLKQGSYIYTYGRLHKTLFFSTPIETVFLYSHKQPAPLMDTFLCPDGVCLITRASTIIHWRVKITQWILYSLWHKVKRKTSYSISLKNIYSVFELKSRWGKCIILLLASYKALVRQMKEPLMGLQRTSVLAKHINTIWIAITNLKYYKIVRCC